VQGLQKATATEGVLASLGTANARSPELELIELGHLLRQLKQMAMRGKARHFDRHGYCEKQVLVLTCELERLLIHADELFPGAALSKWGRTPDYFQGLPQPEKLLEVLSDPWSPEESLTGAHVAARLGVKDWRAISSNVMTDTVKQRVLGNLGWTYVSQPGRGGGSRFKKNGDAVLNPVHWRGQFEPALTQFDRSGNCSESPKE